MKANTLVTHYMFKGNGVIRRIDSKTYSIAMAVVSFPLEGATICRPLVEFGPVFLLR